MHVRIERKKTLGDENLKRTFLSFTLYTTLLRKMNQRENKKKYYTSYTTFMKC